MKTKRIISMLLALCIILSCMMSLSISASAEISWEAVYSNTVASQSKPAASALSLFDGNLNDGGKYRITMTQKLYGAPTGHTLKVFSGDQSVDAWYKNGGVYNYNVTSDDWTSTNSSWNAVPDNIQFTLTAVCDVDLTAKTFAYTLSSDKASDTVSGKVTLKGNSLTSIVFNQWSADTYSYPLSWSISIEKEKETESIWKTVYSNTVASQAMPDASALPLFEGNLNDGGKYRITMTKKVYGTPTGHQLRVYSGDQYENAWYKESGKFFYYVTPDNWASGSTSHSWNAVPDNIQFTLTAVCDVDLTAKTFAYTLSSDKVSGTVSGQIALKDSSLTSIVFSQYGIDSWSYPTSWSISIEEEVEVEWETIHSATLAKDSSSAHVSIYKGDLSLASGNMYRVTWDGSWYNGQIDGGTLRVADSDSEKDLFWREGTLDSPIKYNGGSVAYTAAASNPKPFKFVLTFDCFGSAPVAKIDVYDIDKATLAGTFSVDLTGIDSIKDLYYNVWSSGNLGYSVPHTGNILIEKMVQEELVETKTLTSASASGTTISVDMDIVAVDEDIPYALIAAYYSGDQLVYADIVSDTVVAGDAKEDHTFTIPGTISGDYNNVVIYLWDGVETIEPYCAPVPVN